MSPRDREKARRQDRRRRSRSPAATGDGTRRRRYVSDHSSPTRKREDAARPGRGPRRPDNEKGKSPPPGSDKAPEIKPDFGLSGKLAAETNTVNGVVLKYAEPAEARKPKDRWRLYVFKDEKEVELHHVDTASAYLFGRDRKVADIPTDHPSCSGQHAVLQFRQTSSRAIRPYVIDLASTNGTVLNGDRIPAQRYVELRTKDVIRFAFSTREYVLLSE
ncbi:SMAD/FHA domain-containing protein [Linderina pennispora]|uniref:SMAD/FHA domain-containing protein n=1 Tax=Linderina pennispora TaxID=61395 RepID=A0A1Y1WKN7_9FUNG|nr:SMAD/FHA domain-containing protein [Linderina pennispora]ORX74141.1 SMAD/FHA domain-containing protein [Linderina pennispora]